LIIGQIFLIKEIIPGQDGDFSEEALVEKSFRRFLILLTRT
jgi:hypothetical protein